VQGINSQRKRREELSGTKRARKTQPGKLDRRGSFPNPLKPPEHAVGRGEKDTKSAGPDRKTSERHGWGVVKRKKGKSSERCEAQGTSAGKFLNWDKEERGFPREARLRESTVGKY